MADNFYAGNGNLATKQLPYTRPAPADPNIAPPRAPPQQFYQGNNGSLASKMLPYARQPAPFGQDVMSVANGLGEYLSRGYNAVAPVVSDAATNVANAARVGGAYFGGDRPSLNADDNFHAGNGNLATKLLPASASQPLPSAAPPSAGLSGYFQRFWGGPAASAPSPAPDSNIGQMMRQPSFPGLSPTLLQGRMPPPSPADLQSRWPISQASPTVPSGAQPAVAAMYMSGRVPPQGFRDSPSPQTHADIAANALAAANGAPRAHSISVEYGGNPNPRVFNFNADGSPAPAPAPEMPKLDFSKMTPGQVANAYMQPGVPHKALRDAFSMSALNNPHAQMAGRYYELVSKLIASGMDPLNMPKGSLVASELAALREGMSAGYYQTDRTLGTGLPQ